jgi:hypothetical protein
MIAVGMGDEGARDGLPRVDVEAAAFAEQPTRSFRKKRHETPRGFR